MTKKFRFHALGLAHTISDEQYCACAYTTKVIRFCKMMTERGHTVFHYGHEKSDVTCTEHITCVPDKLYQEVYGDHDYRKKFFKYDLSDPAYTAFNDNAVREIEKRKEPHDFLLCFWGMGHKEIADRLSDIIVVEPGIGYAWAFARFRIYESYAILHGSGGDTHISSCKEDWYHWVIPNYFDPNDFEFRAQKGDYFLYLGRVYSGKGVDIAVQVCRELGVKLIVAGQGSLEEMGYEQGPLLTHVGYADKDKRKELMAGAKAVFIPSLYNEPFGGVSVEALFSGTPVISSDWGAFTENIIHGKVGYRCRTFEHFLWAAKNIGNIDPFVCREYAMQNFTIERIADMYLEYFQSVHDIYFDKGWYTIRDDRQSLDWLKRST